MKLTILNLDKNEAIELTETSGSIYLLDKDWGKVKVAKSYINFANGLGLQESSRKVEPRPISFIGALVATDEEQMNEHKRKINRFFNPLDRFKLQYLDYEIEFTMDESLSYTNKLNDNNEIVCKFLIEGTCPNPYFRGINKTEVKAGLISKKMHFTFHVEWGKKIPIASVFSNNVYEVDNDGDIPVGFMLSIDILGTIVNPSISFIENNEVLKFNFTLKEGDKVYVDTTYGKEKAEILRGKETINLFIYMTKESKLLQLPQGKVKVKLAADSGEESIESSFEFYKLYSEVEETR